jgi:hypothetical protein
MVRTASAARQGFYWREIDAIYYRLLLKAQRSTFNIQQPTSSGG